MAQLEENWEFPLTRPEQKVGAYSQLHAGELEELARGVAELRREFRLLKDAAFRTPDGRASRPLARAHARRDG